ncbi:hypothetical protein D3C71_474450 [compost metagenome]
MHPVPHVHSKTNRTAVHSRRLEPLLQATIITLRTVVVKDKDKVKVRREMAITTMADQDKNGLMITNQAVIRITVAGRITVAEVLSLRNAARKLTIHLRKSSFAVK